MFKSVTPGSEEWLIREKGFKFGKQKMWESLFTLGNGYMGLRGSFEENPHGSYRGLYIAGIFDKAEAFVPELVKAPGWLDFSVWVNGKKFNVDTCKVLSHERVLDMKKGILFRTTRLKNSDGKIIKFESKRVVFSHQVRGSVLMISVTPQNFSGEINILSGLNGEMTNLGYYPRERIKHLSPVCMKRHQKHVYLEMETRDNKIRIAMASNTVFENAPPGTKKISRIYGEKFSEHLTFQAEKGKEYHFTKWVSIFTSREGYETQLEAAATDLLHDMVHDGLSYHLRKHIEVRERMWERADIEIKGDRKAQKGIRFNIYHLLIAKPHHDQTVSIGAKFLTGEGYKGHAFWDTEIFILPFYVYNFPEDARNLLLYRYYTLKGAIKNARSIGCRGAKYAWESAATGEEATPSYGLRADESAVKIFTGEEEHHIVSDVAYAVFKYIEASGDNEFLFKFGAEIIFQTARFWASRVEKRRDRYEIRKIVGPDEFHEHVDNNAFTSYLAIWNLAYAVELYRRIKKEDPKQFKALQEKIKLSAREIEEMEAISRTIYFPYDKKTELIEQFEGYFSLDDVVVKQLDKSGLPKFPRGIDNSNAHRSQLIKQADVVLLLYLFLDRFTDELKKKNYKYYEARTMHKSSLSPCTYAMMGLETGDHKRAYDYFIKTSYMDLVDANRNTCDGIHAAATGGSWMTVIHGFGGMRVRMGKVNFDPWLPKHWQELGYTFYWQGSYVKVKIAHQQIVFTLLEGKGINIQVRGKPVSLKGINRPIKIRFYRK